MLIYRGNQSFRLSDAELENAHLECQRKKDLEEVKAWLCSFVSEKEDTRLLKNREFLATVAMRYRENREAGLGFTKSMRLAIYEAEEAEIC